MNPKIPTGCVDPELIARYDVAAPRYTSYPPASHFVADFGEAALRAEIARSEQYHRPLSLYVHIPFCSTVCLYCACTKIVTRNRAHGEQYLEQLERELALYSPLFHTRSVEQMHWGGGTPTFLGLPGMERLMWFIRSHFHMSGNGEYSIEIDPRSVDREAILGLAGMGFNRISVGVQDFDPRVQHAVHRIQSEAQTREVVEAAREAGFRSVSMDLIYGLPYQSRQSVSKTLDKIIDLSPDRLSIFNYAHLPRLFRMQRLIDPATLPAPGEKLRILRLAVERLTEAGYKYIGMDHFAKATDELTVAQQQGSLWRNFQGYSSHGGSDLLGTGLSAISQVGACYAQNAKDLTSYYTKLNAGQLPVARGAQLTDDDLLRRDVIMGLICNMRLDLRKIEWNHRIRFDRYFASEIRSIAGMVDDGLIEISDSEIVVSDIGRMLVRNICLAFDRYQRLLPLRQGSRAI
ncbi:MAG: oxygen-independent coproporphyrinogen III oxidase [Acidiferrobacteraceae bacterium]